jgi:excisionase family DNA binding protein
MENPDELLSTGQVAELLGVSRGTVWRYVDLGLIPARRLPSGVIRIRRGDLEEFRRARDEA